MALSPRHQLLAAGTAARPHAGWDGGNSRIDILDLWKMDDEPELGHQLEVVTTIPAPSNRAFHRLAWEEAASERQSEFDDLLKDDFIEHSLKGFNLKSKVNRDDVEDWVVLDKPNRTDNSGLVLKLNDISGKVFAISFNNQHKNVLACGGDSEKLKLYQLDHPIKSYELADVGSSSRTTFVDWHPQYPVAIASTCDDATAIGDDATVKIWDLRNTYHPLSDFGPKKGVVSLSWWRNPNLIITTAVDGGVDCWKLNVIEGSEPSRTVYLLSERRSLPLGEKEETAWFDDSVIVASSALNIGLYKLKSSW
ncbi:unnamed protein product [Miscanthus lutarioriparius]|uniref:Uncharacterized protein n=1 Tax=Miscanthus lutarioriparius TaxID=422564 RepID=A0A811RLV5_9POAL|nr:unnamed protein product [Miscanthus lutarioriparius]